MRYCVLFVVLAVFWWLLSGQTSVFFIVSGIVCLSFTLWMAKRLKIVDNESIPLQALVGLVTYIPWLMWQIFLSNIHVAKVVWSSDLGINPRIIRIPLRTKTAFGAMVYANSITLTPGTVTIEVNEDEMVIHALNDSTSEDLMTGAMHDKVCAMEGKRPS